MGKIILGVEAREAGSLDDRGSTFLRLHFQDLVV